MAFSKDFRLLGRKSRPIVATPEREPSQFRIEPPPGNYAVTVYRMSGEFATFESVDDYEVTSSYVRLHMGDHDLYFSLYNIDSFDINIRSSNGN